MSKIYALYNPLSCNGNGETNARQLDVFYPDSEIEYRNVIEIKNPNAFLNETAKDDLVVLCGGDGTINRFVNLLNGSKIEREILYFPIGTGNDFAFDFGFTKGCKPFPINEYIENLPTVKVKGKEYRFLNGIGYGIDGYCCEIGDKKKQKHAKNINYAAIAITGLLFHYKPTSATVTVDGVKHNYRNVWLAPTMNGRYYGGGMMPTPMQKRNSDTLSVMIFHGAGKLKTLMIFPSIFKGEHVNHKSRVEVLTGHEISVEFDRPRALQIDGETVLGVTSYSTAAFSAEPDSANEKTLLSV